MVGRTDGRSQLTALTPETLGVRWVPVERMVTLPLHPGFAATWERRTRTYASVRAVAGPTTVGQLSTSDSRPVGRLVVIEGLDGAGKRTLTAGCSTRSTPGVAHGRRLPPLRRRRARRAGPRRALRPAGRPRGLGARDGGAVRAGPPGRRRRAPRPRCADHDLVLVDRYVASNAAYGAARLHQGAGGEFVGLGPRAGDRAFGIPVPDHQLHLAVPREVAAAGPRTGSAPSRPRPRRLRGRRRPAEAHRRGVRASSPRRRWLSPWTVLDGARATPTALVGPNALADAGCSARCRGLTSRMRCFDP